MLPHARIVQRGPAYTGFSDMRLFELEAICENYLARCRRSALKKQQRESEEEDAEAAIAEHEEDRSPAAQAKKIWRERRISRAMADLAGVRGSR